MKLMFLVQDTTIQIFSFIKNLQLKLELKLMSISEKIKLFKKELLEEGKDSKADLYITADAGN